MILDNFLCNILKCIIYAEQAAIPRKTCKTKRKPYWNEVAAPLKEKALFWHSLWVTNGKPHNGCIADIRRKSQLQYHRAVRLIQRNAESLRYQRLAERVTSNDGETLWNELRRLNPSSQYKVPVIDGK